MAEQHSAELCSTCHRVNGEKPKKMARMHLPKGESDDAMAEIGGCLDFARRSVGWTIDQLSRELGRDSKQVARWIRGEERTQMDVVFSVEALCQPFVIALAQLAKCDVETTVRIKRRA